MYDMVIRNGTVIDGSGSPGRVSDVGIKAGRIAAVGEDIGPATREIDAAGLLVTYWARDRSRGERIPIEQLVHNQTKRTANFYGMYARGLIAPGMKSDLNVIDFDGHDTGAMPGKLVRGPQPQPAA